jgi:hypothetical protein
MITKWRKRWFFKRCEQAYRSETVLNFYTSVADLYAEHPDWYAEWVLLKMKGGEW